MKKQFLTVCVCMALTNFVFASSGNSHTPNDPPIKTTERSSLSIQKVFLGDVENRVLYVDFAAVSEHIIELNILRDGKLMMQDKVDDLPDSTIYEVNLEVIREGTYIVELVMDKDIKIQKEITVQ